MRQMKTVPKAVETSKLTLRVDIHIQLFTISSYLPASDVQACPRCRDDRIPCYDHHDLYLGLCDR